MSYGHAERNLILLRQLEVETRQLLESVDQPDPEQSAWLQEITSGGDDRWRTCRWAGRMSSGPSWDPG